jgi:hypothetical protein
MSRTVTLASSVSGTIANSALTISTGPKFQGEIWFPESVSISCTGSQPTPAAPNIATCSIYVGIAAGGSTFLDGTYQVLGASSSMISGQTIYPGWLVIAVWGNMTGSNGQIATLTVNGTRQIP